MLKINNPEHSETKIIFIFILIFVSATLIFNGLNFRDGINKSDVKAASTDNVAGYAWSENIGWISFNSTNCDIDGDGSYEGVGETGGPVPIGCPTSGTVTFYGVNLDFMTGNLSGYAWSENIGWISFNWPDIKDVSGNECPGGSGIALCQAKLTGVNFFGWARSCSVFASGCSGALKTNSERGSWDGWIKLRKDASDVSGTPNYGVSLSGEDFVGYAWGGDVIGWISFNRANCDADENGNSDGIGGCPVAGTPVADYKVSMKNSPPTVSGLDIIPVGDCYDLGDTTFIWTFSDVDLGDTQAAYQIDFSGPIACSTGKVNSSTSSVKSSALAGGCANYIQYGVNNYSWKVTVWDNDDLSAESTIENSVLSLLIFDPPIAKFSVDNLNPAQFENVIFDPSDSEPIGGINKWVWDFGDGNTETINQVNGETEHVYSETGTYQVDLTVTMGGLISCSASDRGNTMEIIVGLSNKPAWNEINP